MGEWYSAKIGDLVELCKEQITPQDSPVTFFEHYSLPAFDSGEVPTIESGDLIKSNKLIVPENAILVSKLNPQTPRVWEPQFVSSHTPVASTEYLVLLPRDQITRRFLRYLFLSPKVRSVLQSRVSGTSGSHQRVRPADVLSIEVRLPTTLTEQDDIAAILGALDDKIDLNRRMNETLEQIARALFKDWFVDFGPTKAKMAGQAAYLEGELWDLFPEQLDEAGVPEGWQNFQLAEIAKHCKNTISPMKNPEKMFEHYSLPAFDNGQEPVLDSGASIKSNKTVVPGESVLLSKLNPEILRVWLPHEETKSAQVASTEFLAFQPVLPVGRSLLFCLFSSPVFRQTLQGMVTGTSKSHQRVSPPALLGLEVVSGSANVFQAFESAVYPLLKRNLANHLESRTLAQTRDLLLPKLMSGELRVRDTKAQLAEVL